MAPTPYLLKIVSNAIDKHYILWYNVGIITKGNVVMMQVELDIHEYELAVTKKNTTTSRVNIGI